MEKGYSYLLKNLSDSIFEMMLKLQEEHNNSMCIYYTPDLAAYLLGISEDEAASNIYEFKNYANPHIGDISISTASDGRIGIKVFSDGIDIIMNSNPRRFFLRELIEKIRFRNCNLESIKEVFEKEGAPFICENVDDSEFQHVIYFEDENIDEYKYCFTFDVMGSYYHRLIDYDFEKLIHHNCGHKH